jgi:hypothetical protein
VNIQTEVKRHEQVSKCVEEACELLSDTSDTFQELIDALYPTLAPFLTVFEGPKDPSDAVLDAYRDESERCFAEFLTRFRPRLRRALDEQVAETLAGQVAS